MFLQPGEAEEPLAALKKAKKVGSVVVEKYLGPSELKHTHLLVRPLPHNPVKYTASAAAAITSQKLASNGPTSPFASETSRCSFQTFRNAL